MLFVKTEIRNSPIQGFGLFSLEEIKKNTLVWEFKHEFDRRFSADQIDILPDLAKIYLSRSAWKSLSGYYSFCMDDAKYINHSKTPNLGSEMEGVSYSLRDILPGEELTEDYSIGTSVDGYDILIKIRKEFNLPLFLG